ncbi:MAG: hypothetical protein B7Z37_25075 [Verrucomicrobia bacterium 12-59-8]|nr:MAG: hypothetical protein B7Z37_25075 [Verrucomicrobia bacterium 12-59-8]
MTEFERSQRSSQKKDAIKAYAATTAHGAQALARGTLDEIPQEVLDEGISQLSSAYAEKKDIKQAMADFFTGLPQLIATSGILGAGGEHIAQSAHNNAQTSQPQSQPQIPPNTTSNSTATPSGSSQQQSTTVNNGQPSSTPPAALPVPTFEEAGTAKQTIDKLKAQEGPLSADQQKELDGAERAFARKTEDNILKQQAGIEKRGGKLHPTTAKALEAARATLARPRPEGNTDIVAPPGKTTSSTASSSSPLPPADTATTQGVTPPAGTSSVDGAPPAETSSAPARPPGSPSQPPATDSQPSQPSIPQSTTKSEPGSGQPPQTPPSRVPTFEEAIAARNTADKLKAQKSPLSPDQQQTLDAAEKTFARRTEQNILNQQAGIAKRGGKLHPTTAKALADAQAILARPGPGGKQNSPGNADDINSSHADATDGQLFGTESSANGKEVNAQTSLTELIPKGKTSQQQAVHDASPSYGDSLTKASQSHQGSDTLPAIAKSSEQRRAESIALIEKRPNRRSLMSNKISTAVRGPFGELLRKVALLCDYAHDDGSISPLSINDVVIDDSNDGEYLNGSASVRPDIFDPLLTGAHEIGHHIAKNVLSPEALLRIRDVARDTAAWESIIKRNRRLDYYTDPEEIFCRAYSQFVALRSGDPEMLAELDKTLKDPRSSFTQWKGSEFTRIQKALEQELKKIGWL